MNTFLQILLIAGAAFIIWYLIRTIRSNPQAFSKEMFNKSFSTMGILALVLIAFITICIWILRSTN